MFFATSSNGRVPLNLLIKIGDGYALPPFTYGLSLLNPKEFTTPCVHKYASLSLILIKVPLDNG